MIRRVALSAIAAVAMGISLLACAGDGGSGGPSGPGTLQVAGTYDVVFSTTRAEGCQGQVPIGSTQGTLRVSQSGSAVTLHLSEIDEGVRTDPTGELRGTVFTYSGPITIANEEGSITAQGSITGTFDGDGGMDLAFEFSALGCTIEGTIVGDRR